nr:S24 family peptidase [Vibrio nigripulchritudo]
MRRFKSTNRYSIPGLSEYKNLPCSVHELLVPNPESTFLAIAAGDSMMGVGLYDRDVMIVDRMPVVKNRDVVVVNLNHEFACKILDFDRRCLISAHPKHPPVKVLSQDKVSIEGTVTHSIRFHRQSYLINA